MKPGKNQKRIGSLLLIVGLVLLFVESGAYGATVSNLAVVGPTPTFDSSILASCNGCLTQNANLAVKAGDVVVVYASDNPSAGLLTLTGCTVNTVACTVRAAYVNNVVSRMQVWEDYVIASTTGTVPIVATMSGPGAWTLTAVSVTGSNPGTPFDPNTKLGNGAFSFNSCNSAQPCTTTYATTTPNDLILSVIAAAGGSEVFTAPVGFTLAGPQAIVNSWMTSVIGYDAVSTTLSGALVWTLSEGNIAAIGVDAIQGPAGTSTTTSSTSTTATTTTTTTTTTTPPPPPTTTTVTITVQDSMSNAALTGVTVILGGASTTTSSTGVATFANVAVGTPIALTISQTGYTTQSMSITPTSGYTQTIALVKTVTPPGGINLTYLENLLPGIALVVVGGILLKRPV
jgi:hypothetical protein